MNLRTYRAESMSAALIKVKKDLGREAVIVSTRTIKAGGLLGLGARTMVEITASAEAEALPRKLRTDTMSRRMEDDAGLAKGVAMQMTAPAAVHACESISTSAVQRELQDIKSLVEDLKARSKKDEIELLPAELREAYIKMIQNQVAEELAGELIRQINDKRRDGERVDAAYVTEFLIRQIAKLLTPGCSINLDASGRTKVVALVGCTGVGKTTTAAKLAAHFQLVEGKKVGLITNDTYRIAAVEQLRTYAKILNIPLEVVMTPEDVRTALHRLQDCDIVLVDTAGRSQFDEIKLKELSRFLEAAGADEIHLVLSSNCSQPVLMKTAAQFSKLGVNRVIFTKLDEAVGIGTLLNVMQKVKAKISYVTTGQNVPDDIEVANSRRIAEMIVDGDGHSLN